MTFKDQMQTDLEVFVNANEFGSSAVYTDTALNTSNVNVLLDHDVMLQPASYDAHVVETGSTVTALWQDVGEPEKGATFEIDDTVYTVQRILDNNRVVVVVAVTES